MMYFQAILGQRVIRALIPCVKTRIPPALFAYPKTNPLEMAITTQRTVLDTERVRPQTCSTCAMAAIDTCTRHAPTARQDTSPPSDLQGMLAVPRRRIICRAQDLINAVLFVCEGWAASILTLPNGDRQIVSFLLPGDIVSSTLLFRDKPGLLVESITDVACRSFDRSELARRFMSDRSAFGVIAALWIEEKECGEGLVVDLGRRTAEERIARLILSLMDRLASRGMAQGQTIDFPLRQHHIADATGLTPVHVSKLLTDFRRRGLIRISDRSLEVLDDPGLRRVAGIR